MSTNSSTPTAIINEIDRTIIRLPEGTTFYSDSPYLAIAFDQLANGTTHPMILGSGGLPYHARYHIFTVLCNDRAQRTVDHSLSVCNKTILPENYLKLWRKAFETPISIEQFIKQYQLVPTAILSGPLAAHRGARAPWTSSPFDTFDEFEAAYRDQMIIDDAKQTFYLEIDLSQPNAARDAFYGESFLLRYDAPKEPTTNIEVVLQPRAGVTVTSDTAPNIDLFSLI